MKLLLETRHQSAEGMRYFMEYAPCEALRSHVVCFWTGAPTKPQKTPYLHRVLPDGCTDIIFDLNPHFPRAVVIGSMWKPRLVLSSGIPAIGVRFYPGAGLSFLDHPLSELQERVIPLREFHTTDADRLLDQLLAIDGLEHRVATIENWLLSKLSRSPPIDVHITQAIKWVYHQRGRLQVRELAKMVGLCERQLSRKFPLWTGYTPKQFVRLMRFQHTFENVLRSPTIGDADIAAIHGYADQSHMINEFQEFGEGSPSTLRKAALSETDECPIFSIPTLGTLRYDREV